MDLAASRLERINDTRMLGSSAEGTVGSFRELWAISLHDEFMRHVVELLQQFRPDTALRLIFMGHATIARSARNATLRLSRSYSTLNSATDDPHGSIRRSPTF